MFARIASCAALLLTAAADTPRLDVRTGDWTWTAKLRIPGEEPVNQSSRPCMTKRSLQSGFQGPLAMGKASCTVIREARTTHSMSYDLKCHADPGIEGKVSFEMKVLSDARMIGVEQLTLHQQGQSLSGTADVEAVWTSPSCADGTPIE